MEPITSLSDPVSDEEEEDEESRQPERGRVFWLAGVIGLVMLVLWGRLYVLQLVQGASYRDQADNNRFRVVAIPASRGVIYDRNRVVLARNRPSYSIGIVPADFVSADQRAMVLGRLADLLGVPVEQLSRKAQFSAETQFTFIPLASGVSQDTAFVIEERHRDLPGVHVELQPIRDYPFGPVAAPVIGYVGRITDAEYQRLKDDSAHRYAREDVIGQAGLERTFESELRGAPGEEQMEVDATGREVRSLQVNNPNPGHNLALTIDAGLQNLAAEAVTAGIDQYRTASVVALDPRNGQVLALVSLPSYDDNLFAEGISDADYGRLIQDPRHPLLNNAVAAAYPPGTAFDAITALAGFEANVITPKTQIDCQGFITVPNRFDPTVGSKLFDWKALGPQDPESALADACKVFWYEVGGGEPNGKWPGAEVDGLTRYAHLFGLGEPTGIDLVEEAGGLVPSVRWKRQNYNQEWVPMDTYQLAVGEGYVSVSPLQMASVAATLANGGTVYRPQVALEALDNQGNVTATYASDVVRQLPAKPENVALVRQGMVDAASSGKTANGLAFDGTAKLAAVPGWAVAGLTASVEFGTPDANGVLPTHGWFIGFAPADHPVIALAVFVERGTGPADAAKVAQQVFAYYQKETTGH